MIMRPVDPSQVEIFQDALVVKFGSEVIGILESVTSEPAEPHPRRNNLHHILLGREHKTDAVIDVEATHAPEPATPIEPESSPPKDIEQALKEMPFPLLRTLAKLKGTDARGTKANLAARLNAIVTQSNVRAATA